MTLRLRLYIAGRTPNSVAARGNLKTLLENTGNGGAEVEIVDVLEEPERGMDDGVLVIPTLLRVHPEPVRRVIGNLGDDEAARRALELGEAGS